MTRDDKSPVQKDEAWADESLRQQLKEIEREETPERLLLLAKELHTLLQSGNR